MRALRYHPASNFNRFFAYFIDVIPIQFGLYFISKAVFEVSPMVDVMEGSDAMMSSLNAKFLISISTLAIWILYCIVGELSPWRGTFGKKMMGISVVSATGGHLKFGQIVKRNAAKILSAIPLYSGFLAVFFTYGNRAWHDLLSGTAVADRK